MSEFDTRLVTEADKADWRGLFDGYADFYKVVMTDSIADTVWSWLHDPNHVLEGLIARDGQGTAVGIAHVRSCPRPLGGSEIGFLDDMFVHPDARGSGAADALFAALQHHADPRGWTTSAGSPNTSTNAAALSMTATPTAPAISSCINGCRSDGDFADKK